MRRGGFVLKAAPFVDYYKVLDVRPTAAAAVIKGRYYELARLHHPDLGGDPKVMASVNAAWEVLSNPLQKKQYDAKRKLLCKPCLTCKGEGVTYKQKGFTSRIAIKCATCAGTGVKK